MVNRRVKEVGEVEEGRDDVMAFILQFGRQLYDVASVIRVVFPALFQYFSGLPRFDGFPRFDSFPYLDGFPHFEALTISGALAVTEALATTALGTILAFALIINSNTQVYRRKQERRYSIVTVPAVLGLLQQGR